MAVEEFRPCIALLPPFADLPLDTASIQHKTPMNHRLGRQSPGAL